MPFFVTAPSGGSGGSGAPQDCYILPAGDSRDAIIQIPDTVPPQGQHDYRVTVRCRVVDTGYWKKQDLRVLVTVTALNSSTISLETDGTGTTSASWNGSIGFTDRTTTAVSGGHQGQFTCTGPRGASVCEWVAQWRKVFDKGGIL